MSYLREINDLWGLGVTHILARRREELAVTEDKSAEATMELYLDLMSQPCRSVYMFAKSNGIPFTFEEVSLLAGELSSGGRASHQIGRS